MRKLLGRKKRGQASVEYLGTYAWAFFALLVTIGTLNYLGVLNPSSYIPERCNSGSQIQCVDTYLATDPATDETWLYLQLKNNYPREIVIATVTLKDLTETPIIATTQQHLRVLPGRLYTARFSFIKPDIVAGNKETAEFEITYRRFDGTTTTSTHTITGIATMQTRKGDTTNRENYCGDNNINVGYGEECDPPDVTAVPSLPQTNIVIGVSCRSDCTTYD